MQKAWTCGFSRVLTVRQPRQGYTLFELVLVLTLLVIIGAISYPAIDAMLADHRLTAARDTVRARLADIRGRAMKEGRPYKFSFIENSGKFKIEPEDSSAASSGDDRPLTLEGDLPEQVIFCKSEIALLGEATPSPASSYETAAIYLGDGTCRDDVSNLLFFGLPGARATGLQVRPLTGAVSNVEPGKQEEQP